jgi:NADH-quinone oxidoreductase subunit H
VFLIAIAFFTLAERKVMASIQRRRGPAVVGFWGVLQAFADGLKLLFKEAIVSLRANKFLFFFAPLLSLTLSLVQWAVVPLGLENFITNAKLSVLLYLAIGSLGVYAIILAGWASNSRYAFIGSIRSTAQMLSYEVCFSLLLLLINLYANYFSSIEFALMQYRVNIIIIFFSLSMFLVIILPFKTVYSPRNFCTFTTILTVSVMTSALFFSIILIQNYKDLVIFNFLQIFIIWTLVLLFLKEFFRYFKQKTLFQKDATFCFKIHSILTCKESVLKFFNPLIFLLILVAIPLELSLITPPAYCSTIGLQTGLTDLKSQQDGLTLAVMQRTIVEGDMPIIMIKPSQLPPSVQNELAQLHSLSKQALFNKCHDIKLNITLPEKYLPDSKEELRLKCGFDILQKRLSELFTANPPTDAERDVMVTALQENILKVEKLRHANKLSPSEWGLAFRVLDEIRTQLPTMYNAEPELFWRWYFINAFKLRVISNNHLHLSFPFENIKFNSDGVLIRKPGSSLSLKDLWRRSF